MFYPNEWSIFFDEKPVFNSNDELKNEKNNKPNNKAPKTIKGDYDLSIHGNKIVLVDNIDGTAVEARCHPHDNFDVGEGIKEAFSKLNTKREEMRKQKEKEEKEIKIDDYVEVTNPGKTYSRYVTWLYNKVRPYYVCMFNYGKVPNNGTKGKVIAVDNHESGEEKLVAFVTDKQEIYIVEDTGLKKVNKSNV